MRSAMKKIAIVLCLVLLFTTLQITGSAATYANRAEWANTLADLLKTAGNKNPREVYKFFKSVNMRAADWIAQDIEKLGMRIEDVFNGNLNNIYKLAKSVDDSVTSDMSIEEMLSRYGNAVEQRADNNLRNIINKLSDQFIVVKHKQLGGSHYAYTEGLSDDKGSPDGNESNFFPDSQMVLLKLIDHGDRVEIVEEVLLESKDGVIRDPDVSEDGLKVLFSWKKDKKDDFHLYEMNLETREIRQLTFGPGVADTEPKYLNNGKIIFSSTRAIQSVDCWITPVSNLFMCDADGKNIVRIGYDQVHTTYPTVTSDGRILYTRWDYNDRTQMYVQGVFQMQADGTNQTELFGNNANFPTTLLHTREIPGVPGLYISIASGHHTLQAGKLVILDISKGRNSPDAVKFVFPDQYSTKQPNIDAYGQEGALYKYPYAINAHEYLVSYAPDGYASDKRKTPFGIYYMHADGTRELLSEPKDGEIGASQVVPVKKRTLFDRPNLVDYSSETGVFYIGNIYEGEGMKGVKKGEAKYLRVVALEFRTAAIGANQSRGYGSADPFSPVSIGNGSWDVKKVLGIVPIEEDGSVLFRAPARVPLYFQVLNERGEMIQSMRSWATLMPGENFSCVGCHEDKNTVPPLYGSRVTMAMLKGVQDIIPDFWQTGEGYENYDPYKDARGFSFMKEIQPILDKSCVSCHNNRDITIFESIPDIDVSKARAIFAEGSSWKYSTQQNQPANWNQPDFNDSSWQSGKAPFGKQGTPPGGIATNWDNRRIYLRKEFNITQSQLNANTFFIYMAYDENPEIYVNGKKILSESGYTTKYAPYIVTKEIKEALKVGRNVIAVTAENTGGGQFIDLGLYTTSQASSTNPNPMSLEAVTVRGSREKRDWPLSYLVLTQAEWNGRGIQLIANSTNKYTNWISGMSQPEILRPYQFGSSKSYLITLLREGHGNLTDVEIRKIAAWIDLGVPMAGSYDEQAAWSANDLREYEEKNNKRAFYEMADEMALRALRNGGVYPDSRQLTIRYFDNNGQELASVTGSGLVQLVAPRAYRTGYKIRVELPEGEKYLFFNLDSRVKEALIYVPDGVFEYVIPSYINSTMPNTVKMGTDVTFNNPMITARLPLKEDLEQVRNLAMNPYDISNNAKAFPHASASNSYGNGRNPEFDPRNAIDGFKNNLGHGTYPVQSWGPDNNVNDLWYQVDFGREVEVNKIAITIRADFPHDTYFRAITVQFSDGSTEQLVLKQTKETQVFEIGSRVTSSIKLINFKKASNTWAAITELEVFGRDIVQ